MLANCKEVDKKKIEETEKNNIRLQIQKNLYSVDYVSSDENYFIEQPFTYVNMVMIEQFHEHCLDSKAELD